MEKIGEEVYVKRIELAKKITYSIREILDKQSMPDAIAAVGLGIGVNIKEFETMIDGRISAEDIAETITGIISDTIQILKSAKSKDTTEEIKPEAEA